jgi:tRNA pseudouridine(55) synthase
MPVFLNKPKGFTPLELVKKYKRENNIKGKVCFAGRLDPMAHGKMILLVKEECKLMNSFCELNKTYEFIVLFGVKTDTYDLLGKILETNFKKSISKELDLDLFRGKISQEYPAYSSIIIRHNEERRPIWEWTNLGKLSEIKIPKKTVEIFSLEEIEPNINLGNSKELLEYILRNINLLSESNLEKFRVPEISKLWKENIKDIEFKPIIRKFRSRVSSGTYIRSLTNRMGEILGSGAITLDIERIDLEVKINSN